MAADIDDLEANLELVENTQHLAQLDQCTSEESTRNRVGDHVFEAAPRD